MYDSAVRYTKDDFRKLTPAELIVMLKEAKRASLDVRGLKLIKKVTKDISDIRLLLNGFDSIHNEVHR